MRYGDNQTIHDTRHLEVEVDIRGKVVAVWFRCMRLPFEATVVDFDRAAEMRAAYERDPAPALVAVDVRDETPLAIDQINNFLSVDAEEVKKELEDGLFKVSDAEYQRRINVLIDTAKMLGMPDYKVFNDKDKK